MAYATYKKQAFEYEKPKEFQPQEEGGSSVGGGANPINSILGALATYFALKELGVGSAAALPTATVTTGAAAAEGGLGGIAGPSIGGAAGAGGTEAGGAAAGAGPIGLGALTAALLANRAWNQGGKEFLQGKANRSDTANTLLNIANPANAFQNDIFSRLTGHSIGGALMGEKRTAVEGDRLKNLAKNLENPALMPGYNAEDADFGFKDESRGRGQQLSDVTAAGMPSDYRGMWENPEDKKKQWVNTKFLASGKEEDLAPEDIWGYAAFGEHLGDKWYSGSEQDRWRIAKAALEAGAVREHHGTIDVDWDKTAEYLSGKKDELPAYAPTSMPSTPETEDKADWDESPIQDDKQTGSVKPLTKARSVGDLGELFGALLSRR